MTNSNAAKAPAVTQKGSRVRAKNVALRPGVSQALDSDLN